MLEPVAERIDLSDEDGMVIEGTVVELTAAILKTVPAKFDDDPETALAWRSTIDAGVLASVMTDTIKHGRAKLGDRAAHVPIEPMVIQTSIQTVFDALSEMLQEPDKKALN